MNLNRFRIILIRVQTKPARVRTLNRVLKKKIETIKTGKYRNNKVSFEKEKIEKTDNVEPQKKGENFINVPKQTENNEKFGEYKKGATTEEVS